MTRTPQDYQVTVAGAGATGGFLASQLIRTGATVTVLARGATADALTSSGVHVTDINGDLTVARPSRVASLNDPDLGGDILFVCLKGYTTRTLIDQMGSALGNFSAVVCFQNGVNNEEALAQVVDASSLVPGVMYIGAHRTSVNSISVTAPCRLIVGPFDKASPDAAIDADRLLQQTDIQSLYDPDVWAQKWQKYLFNCALNPLTAVTGERLGALLGFEPGAHLFTSLLDEALAAGNAAGAPIAADARDHVMETAHKMDISSSMAEDLAAGRRLETDAFTGHVLSILGPQGAPVTFAFDQLLRILESRSGARAQA